MWSNIAVSLSVLDKQREKHMSTIIRGSNFQHRTHHVLTKLLYLCDIEKSSSLVGEASSRRIPSKTFEILISYYEAEINDAAFKEFESTAAPMAGHTQRDAEENDSDLLHLLEIHCESDDDISKYSENLEMKIVPGHPTNYVPD